MSSRIELPFLYCTRTILRHASRRQIQQVRRSFQTSRAGKSTQIKGGYQFSDQENNSSFLKRKAASIVKKPTSNLSTGDSTLTPAERAAFDRLLSKSDEQYSEPPPRHHDAEDPTNVDADSILELFKATVNQHERLRGRKSQDHQKSETSSKPLVFQPSEDSTSQPPEPTRRIFSALEPDDVFDFEPELENDVPQDDFRMSENEDIARLEENEAVQKAVDQITQDQFREIAKSLADAVSKKDKRPDLAIWEVCEEHIFPLIELLRTQNRFNITTKEESSTEAKTSSSPRKSAHPLLQLLAKHETALETGASPSQPRASTIKITPLSVISILYPASLLLVQRLLIRHAPTSPLGNSLLPRIRALGPTSYVLGANTHLYNTLLTLKWTVYSDMPAIDGLLAEMERSALEIDLGTFKILDQIEQDRRLEIWSMMKERQARQREYYNQDNDSGAAGAEADSVQKSKTPPKPPIPDLSKVLLSLDPTARSAQWWLRPETAKWFQRTREWKTIVLRRVQARGIEVSSVLREYGDEFDFDPTVKSYDSNDDGITGQRLERNEYKAPGRFADLVRSNASSAKAGRVRSGMDEGRKSPRGGQGGKGREGNPVVML